MKTYIVIPVICFFICLGCNPDRKMVSEHVKSLKEHIYVPLDANWIIKEYGDGDEPRFSIQTEHLDTTYEVSYIVLKEKPIYIDFFSKKYKKDDFYYRIEFNYRDTTYFYKSKDEMFQDKKFIFGKYMYLASHKQLTKGQLKYFHEHYDSLSLIRGDSLPELPSMDE